MRDKTGSRGDRRKCRKKRKYGNVELDTTKATTVGGEIGRRAKGHKR